MFLPAASNQDCACKRRDDCCRDELPDIHVPGQQVVNDRDQHAHRQRAQKKTNDVQ